MPTLWLIVGPNGAGKTTLVKKYNDKNLPVSNPDEIAVTFDTTNEVEAHIRAARIALEQRQRWFTEGFSFIVETTFSGARSSKIIEQAKHHGFHVHMIYMHLNSPEQSLERVKIRVAKGGHNVPQKDIFRRFPRVKQNIERAKLLVDQFHTFDNAGDEYPAIPIKIFEPI